MARLPENNAPREGTPSFYSFTHFTKELALFPLKFGDKEYGMGNIFNQFTNTRKDFIV